ELALELLVDSGELEATAGRHAEYFLALAEAAEPHLRGAEQDEWLARLEAEHDNLRAALSWALAHGQVELALRPAWGLGRVWLVDGPPRQGRGWRGQAPGRGPTAPLA